MTEPEIERGSRAQAFAFALAFLALILIEVAGLAAVNAVVDPRSEFGGSHFRPIIENDVEIKLQHFEALDVRPQTVVFGSSRSMTLDPRVLEELGYGPTFNFALLPSTPMDALVVYRMMVSRGEKPRDLIIGVELDQVQPGREIRWQIRTSTELSPFVGKEAGPVDVAARVLGTLERAYVRDTLLVLLYSAKGYPDAENVFTPDGRVARPRDDAALQNGTLDASSAIGLDHPLNWIRRYEEYTLPGAAATAAVSELVNEARMQGANVTWFMAPYLPELYAILSGLPSFERNQGALRSLLTSQCQAGVRVFDYSNVSTFGGDGRDFFDGHHFLGPTARAIAEGLASSRNELCMLTNAPL